METARAQIAEAQAYKAELETIHAALKRSREEVAAFAGGGALPPRHRAGEPRARRHRARHRAGDPAIAAGRRGHRPVRQHAVGRGSRASTRRASPTTSSDRVVQIFEACNFQDLTGQRVGKVVETLAFLEEHVDRLMEIWQRVERFKPVVFDERPTATGDSSTARSLPATPATPRRTTSTRCSIG